MIVSVQQKITTANPKVFGGLAVFRSVIVVVRGVALVPEHTVAGGANEDQSENEDLKIENPLTITVALFC